MDAILVKVFAAAVAFSQAATDQEVRTSFNSETDQAEVVRILQAGCARMIQAFDIENLNIDDLLTTAMDDPEAVTNGTAAFRGIAVKDLHLSYLKFCKNEAVDSPVDLAEVIAFYNHTLTDLPDSNRLKGFKL